MKKLMGCVLSIAAVSFFCSGCAMVQAPFSPPNGFVYNQTRAPLSLEYNKTNLGDKRGTAEATSVLGMIATGDCSIETAARNGGIKTITHADYEFQNILGIFTKTTVIVYGTAE